MVKKESPELQTRHRRPTPENPPIQYLVPIHSWFCQTYHAQVSIPRQKRKTHVPKYFCKHLIRVPRLNLRISTRQQLHPGIQHSGGNQRLEKESRGSVWWGCIEGPKLEGCQAWYILLLSYTKPPNLDFPVESTSCHIAETPTLAYPWAEEPLLRQAPHWPIDDLLGSPKPTTKKSHPYYHYRRAISLSEIAAWAIPTPRQTGAMNRSITRNHLAGRRQIWKISQCATKFSSRAGILGAGVRAPSNETFRGSQGWLGLSKLMDQLNGGDPSLTDQTLLSAQIMTRP